MCLWVEKKESGHKSNEREKACFTSCNINRNNGMENWKQATPHTTKRFFSHTFSTEKNFAKLQYLVYKIPNYAMLHHQRPVCVLCVFVYVKWTKNPFAFWKTIESNRRYLFYYVVVIVAVDVLLFCSVLYTYHWPKQRVKVEAIASTCVQRKNCNITANVYGWGVFFGGYQRSLFVVNIAQFYEHKYRPIQPIHKELRRNAGAAHIHTNKFSSL